MCTSGGRYRKHDLTEANAGKDRGRFLKWLVMATAGAAILVFFLRSLMGVDPHPDHERVRVFSSDLGSNAVRLRCEVDFSDPESWQPHDEVWEFSVDFLQERTNLFDTREVEEFNFEFFEGSYDYQGQVHQFRDEYVHMKLRTLECQNTTDCDQYYYVELDRAELEHGPRSGSFKIDGGFVYDPGGPKLLDYFDGYCVRLEGKGPLYEARFPEVAE